MARLSPARALKFDEEMDAAREARIRGDSATAWSALERAHLLGQPSPLAHLRNHWAMWTLALRTRDVPEILGQIPRLLLSVPGSITGRAPSGNTGRSSVGIFATLPIPEELRPWIGSNSLDSIQRFPIA